MTGRLAKTTLILVGIAMSCACTMAPREEEPVGRAGQKLAASGTLPGGTSIGVAVDSPADGATVLPAPLTIKGTANVGVAPAVAKTLLVYALDVSFSETLPSGCGGDANNDGVSNTGIDCEIAAAEHLNGDAIALGTVAHAGVAIFGEAAATGDVSPASGDQLLTTPAANVNNNPVRDIDGVLSSANANTGSLTRFTTKTVGSNSTSYGAGIQAALAIAAASSDATKIVVFLSDGQNNTDPSVASVLASPPPNTTFFTFAVGSGASCTGAQPPSLGSLQDIADLTGGTCTLVPDPAALPDILPQVIASQLQSIDVTVDGAPALTTTITPPLPQAGPQTVSFEATAGTLPAGHHQLCATATGSDGGGTGSVHVCNDVVVDAPPVAQCANLTLTAGATCSAGGSINAGSFDPDGTPVTCVQAPAGPYPLGTTTVTLTCADPLGLTAACSGSVTVIDTTPPSIACPTVPSLACVSRGAVATFAPTAADNCGAPNVACNPPSGSTFPLGSTVDTCTALDAAGNAAACEFTVDVSDTTPPVVTVAPSPVTLWPPNHEYRAFSLSDCVTSVTSSCAGPISIASTGKILRITSDEAENARGSGDTCNDVVITGNTTADLRAERSGSGDGRVYTVFFEVDAGTGLTTNASCRVQVPHDQSGAPAVDSGCAYCVGKDCGTCPTHDPTCRR